MSYSLGQTDTHVTAAFNGGAFNAEKTDLVLGQLITTGMLDRYTLSGDTLTLSWPIGATPPPNPYSGWHTHQAERIPFGPHDPDKTASQTAALFVDLIRYDISRCKVALPAQK